MKKEKTFWCKIYLSGDIAIIKNTCREFCMKVGLCVTITPTLFIYTGGEEYGVEIGLINYPRFPAIENEILDNALKLAELCRASVHQWSYLVMTPKDTLYHSTRDDK